MIVVVVADVAVPVPSLLSLTDNDSIIELPPVNVCGRSLNWLLAAVARSSVIDVSLQVHSHCSTAPTGTAHSGRVPTAEITAAVPGRITSGAAVVIDTAGAVQGNKSQHSVLNLLEIEAAVAFNIRPVQSTFVVEFVFPVHIPMMSSQQTVLLTPAVEVAAAMSC
jgi:hypothetical protein